MTEDHTFEDRLRKGKITRKIIAVQFKEISYFRDTTFIYFYFDVQVSVIYSVAFHLRNLKMGSEICDIWSQVLMNVVNTHHN